MIKVKQRVQWRSAYSNHLVVAGLVLNIFLALLPMLLRFMTTQQVDLSSSSNKFRYAGCSTRYILSYQSCTEWCGEAPIIVSSCEYLRDNLPSQSMYCEMANSSHGTALRRSWRGYKICLSSLPSQSWMILLCCRAWSQTLRSILGSTGSTIFSW